MMSVPREALSKPQPSGHPDELAWTAVAKWFFYSAVATGAALGASKLLTLLASLVPGPWTYF